MLFRSYLGNSAERNKTIHDHISRPRHHPTGRNRGIHRDRRVHRLVGDLGRGDRHRRRRRVAFAIPGLGSDEPGARHPRRGWVPGEGSVRRGVHPGGGRAFAHARFRHRHLGPSAFRPHVPGLSRSGHVSPFVEPDFIAAIIEVPQNRTYTLVQSLPYDIVVTGNITSIDSGSANVAYPSNGPITSGNPINITVSSVSSPEFLRVQLNFTRTFAT